MSTTRPRDGETDDFAAYTRLADNLIAGATKEQLPDVARLLALNIGWYHQRYGDVPQETLLRMVRAETLTEETEALLLHGMQNLVSALGESWVWRAMTTVWGGIEAVRVLPRVTG